MVSLNFRTYLSLLMVFAALCCASSIFAGPKVSTPKAPINPEALKRLRYPWKKNITATVFWVGEKPTANNPTPNHKSSWDVNWQQNFGGFDDPDGRRRGANYAPLAFTPKLNPFYVALPYNDVINHKMHKPEALRVIPWLRRYYEKPGKTVCKGRWVQIYYKKRICYAQWEDCGPFVTDDWEYVFGKKPPKNTHNKNAGIDLSPAVRDYLKLKSGDKVHWRFIEFSQIPKGPWARYGMNNPFVNPDADPEKGAAQRYLNYLYKKRDEAYRKRDRFGN